MLRKILCFLLLILSMFIFFQGAFAAAKAKEAMSLQESLGIDLTEWVQELEVQPVLANGIEIRLNEAALDYRRVYFSLTLISEKIHSESSISLSYIQDGLIIEGKSFDVRISGLGTTVQVDGNTNGSITIFLYADIPDEILISNSIPIQLKIGEIFYYEEELFRPPVVLEGPWEFEFSVDGTVMRESTRIIPLDHVFLVDNSAYMIENLFFSPIRTGVEINRMISKSKNIYDERFDTFWSPNPSGNILGFSLADEHGNKIMLTELSEEYSEEAVRALYCTYFSDENNNGWNWLQNAQELTITPYFSTLSGPVNQDRKGIERYYFPEPLRIPLVQHPSHLEEFMSKFEPHYKFGATFDSENPYVKSVRMQQTTKNGTVIMLDKVLVTEDRIAVSILLGSDKIRKDQKDLMGFEIGPARIELWPILPYTPDFNPDIKAYAGGGGGPSLNIVSADPLVTQNIIFSPMMFTDGYVSPKETVHVKVTIYYFDVSWCDTESYEYTTWNRFREDGPWVFEFDTDGIELAELTKEINIFETIDIQGQKLTLKSLRWNPLQPILFVSNYESSTFPEIGIPGLTVFIETDDGTLLRLDKAETLYQGFTRVFVDEETNKLFNKTENLKVAFCLDKLEEYPQGYNPEEKRFYLCDEKWQTTINLR